MRLELSLTPSYGKDPFKSAGGILDLVARRDPGRRIPVTCKAPGTGPCTTVR